MKKQVTVITCDVCGNEFDEVNDGVVRLSKHQEIRFDICAEDTEKLFGSIEPSKRRGGERVKQEA